MRKLINKTLVKIKGEHYSIDSALPLSYLIATVMRRIIMVIRGVLIFCRKSGIVFVGSNTKIRCKSKLQLGRSVTIDRNCYIDALSYDGIILGNNVSVGKYTTIECTGSLTHIGKGLKVENNVGLGTHGFLGCAGGVEIGENTILGNYVSIHSENHNYSDTKIPIRLQGVSHKGIKIGSDCWIGAKVTILDGAMIGKGCIFAAACVVTAGNYEDFGIYAGVPAKLVRYRK